MAQLATTSQDPASILEGVMIKGDLAQLNEKERVTYYKTVCQSLNLNPMTKPFDYITLNGKMQLYAKRDCAEQLRTIHGVSIKVLSKEEIDGIYIVTVAAQNKHGRHDEDTGAVSIAGLRGEARANAILKAITKAKRRVTLSICGLGLIDETEADDIPGTPPVSYDLDEIFPDGQENKAPGSPQIAKEPPSGPEVPEEKEVPESAPEGRTEDYLLLLGNDEVIQYDSSKDFYDEYQKQQKSIFGDEKLTPKERMTKMKGLETDNEKSLGMIPEVGKKRLYDKRLAFNAKLGAAK